MESNKIYNENCLETMAKMPDCFVDCVVTSPPYDNLRSYDTGIGNEWNFETFKPIAKELFRVLKLGGVVVWVVNDKTDNGSETGTSFKQALYFMQCGFNLHDTMIWHKNNMPIKSNRYQSSFEFMFVLSRGKPETVNLLTEKNKAFGKRKTHGEMPEKGSASKRTDYVCLNENKVKDNVWYIPVGFGMTSKDIITSKHVAPFPEKLAQDHIISWTNENDLVYDPFGGSGTTAKMAHLNNRKWILSEISSNYCSIAEKRLEPYLNQKNLFF